MRLKVNANRLVKKTILLIIITLIFLITTKSLASQDELSNQTRQQSSISIQTDKAQYEIGETVSVSVTVHAQDISNYRLYYEYQGFVQRYMGNFTQFSFVPRGIGTHYLVLRDLGANEVSRQSFEVIEKSGAITGAEEVIEEKPAPQAQQQSTISVKPIIKPLKNFFKQQEDAVFEFSFETKEKTFQKRPKQQGTWLDNKEKIVAKLSGPQGSLQDTLPEIEQLNDGHFRIRVPKSRAFRPGEYKLKIELTTENTTYAEEQNFLWGVLAINTHKSIYLPTETAFIGMAVLDNAGRMVCDANVTLEITAPDGNRMILSIATGTINVSPECNVYGVTNLPDYYANYSVSGPGIYVMNLTAMTFSGTRNIVDSFTVQDSVEYDVSRSGPTRIYPLVPYTMNFTIKANQDYSGPVREHVPASFIIQPSPEFSLSVVNNTQLLEWNKQLSSGETYNLVYTFDAPDMSPYIFTLGPLEIGKWHEAREWLIASDIELETLYDDCNGAAPNNTKFYFSYITAGNITADGSRYILDSNATSGNAEMSIYTAGLKDNFTKVKIQGTTRRDLGTGRGYVIGIGNGSLWDQTFCQNNVGYAPSYGYAVCMNSTLTSLWMITNSAAARIDSDSWIVANYTEYNFTMILNSSGVFFYVNDTLKVNSTYTNYSQGYLLISTGGGTTNRGTWYVNNVWYYDEKAPPTVNINASLDELFTNDTTPSVDFNFTDAESSTANCTLYFDDSPYNTTNDINNNTQTTLKANASISDGNHSVYVNCTNIYGAIGNSSTVNIVIDTTSPFVQAVSPANNNWTYVITPDFAFNYTDNLSSNASCTLFIGTGMYGTNASAHNNTQTIITANDSPSDGSYSWNVTCTDLAGNSEGSTARTITIDSLSPNVDYILPENNNRTGSTTPSFVFNYTDALSPNASCVLYVDSVSQGSNSSVHNYTATTIISGSLADGNHSWNITCTDLAGNIAGRTKRNMTVDASPPVVLSISPADNNWTNINMTAFVFIANDSVSNRTNCLISVDGINAGSNSSVLNNTQTTITTSSPLSDGLHAWRANCTDDTGNTGFSAEKNLTIDTTAPTVNINTSLNNTVFNTSTPTFDFNFTDSYSNTTNCTLYLNDTAYNITNGISNNTQTNLTANTSLTNSDYTAYINCTDLAGNVNTSTILKVQVAVNYTPTIDDVSSVPAQVPNPEADKVVEINFTASDQNGVGNLNDSSARVIVNYSGITREGNCTPNDINDTATNYNCSVAMMYYDPAGTWTINVTVIDNSQLSAYNATVDFTYQELLYIQVDPVVFGFGDFYPGQSNQAALSNPLLIDNMGNVNLTRINITAYDLVNGSYYVGAGNFTVNVSDAPGTALQNNTLVNIPYANVSVDLNGVDANESLYFYISAPNVPPLNFTSSTYWVITADK